MTIATAVLRVVPSRRALRPAFAGSRRSKASVHQDRSAQAPEETRYAFASLPVATRTSQRRMARSSAGVRPPAICASTL
jgi:hypothetical protein